MEAPPLVPPTEAQATQAPAMSLPARLLNVFAVPGDVFAEVKAAPRTASNWVVPMLISAVIGAVAAILIFSQPAIQQQMREIQTKAMAEQVKKGKMTQAQADQVMDAMDKVMGPTMWKLAGAGGAVVVSVARTFWWALVIWLLGRWALKTDCGYMKALEVTGLALMISVLGAAVTVLLQLNLARMFATPSLALALTDFDLTRKSHVVLGALNVFSFWQVAVLALGLAKLANTPFLRAAWAVFGYWVAQEAFFILTGMGQMAL